MSSVDWTLAGRPTGCCSRQAHEATGEHAYAGDDIYFTQRSRTASQSERGHRAVHRPRPTAGVGDHGDTSARTRLRVRPPVTASYITGAHAFKVGFNLGIQRPARSRSTAPIRPHQLPVQQRRAEPVHACRPRRDGRQHRRATITARSCRTMDGQAADGHRRRALRLLPAYHFPAQTLGPGDVRCRRATLASRNGGREVARTCSRGSASPTTCSATARPR